MYLTTPKYLLFITRRLFLSLAMMNKYKGKPWVRLWSFLFINHKSVQAKTSHIRQEGTVIVITRFSPLSPSPHLRPRRSVLSLFPTSTFSMHAPLSTSSRIPRARGIHRRLYAREISAAIIVHNPTLRPPPCLRAASRAHPQPHAGVTLKYNATDDLACSLHVYKDSAKRFWQEVMKR